MPMRHPIQTMLITRLFGPCAAGRTLALLSMDAALLVLSCWLAAEACARTGPGPPPG